MKNRTSISERPPIVDTRSRLGDLEIDTVIGKGQKGAILTINDRKAGFYGQQNCPVKKQGG